MTREEAALVRLRLMAQRAFGAMVENRRGGSEEAQKDLDAIDWAIATIQSKKACSERVDAAPGFDSIRPEGKEHE